MIRYDIHPRTWETGIEALVPGWQARAATRTAAFQQAGRYDERSGIWGEIKRFYMSLQGFKCGFCERRLEKSQYGNVEHDVEHFRPKGRVDAWPTAEIAADRGLAYNFNLGPADANGYFMLAYHRENYLISCKTCNSALKRNYFPIAGPPRRPGTDPRDMRDERPFLIYPLGAVDDNPESLIEFDGILPRPVGARGHKRRRGQVTIDFFALDRREVLLEERAETILTLHLALNGRASADDTTRAISLQLVERLTSREAPHAGCARSFRRRFESDQAAATETADAALDYLLSLVP